VEFYSPKCRHCRSFQPHYSRVAEELQTLQSSRNLNFSHFDCAADYEFCSNQSVSAYPSLLVYYNGLRQKEYMGEFDYASVKDYATKMADRYFGEAVAATGDTQLKDFEKAGTEIWYFSR
jgi:thioredoxin domain-containing protein 5